MLAKGHTNLDDKFVQTGAFYNKTIHR